jgi:FixJ family two-component response regulator
MGTSRETIFVADKDRSVRRELQRLLSSVGYTVETFDSAEALLRCDRPGGAAALVLESRMIGVDAPELREWLAEENRRMPIVFITKDRDIRSAVRAMKAGAIDYLTKPLDVEKLLDAIARALCADRAARARLEQRWAARQRTALLTPREYEVLELVATGMLNKQIADNLGTSEKTIKVHRARAMEKAEVSSVPELVRFVDRLRAMV